MDSITGIIGWNQIITLLLTSAVINGALSAFVNYILNQRKSKRDRDATIIQEKLNIYSNLIDRITRLIEIGPKAFPPDQYIKYEYTSIFKELDAILSNKSYLLENNIYNIYTWIKDNYLQNAYRIEWDISEKEGKTVKTQLECLQLKLIDTYTEVIINMKDYLSKSIVEKFIQNYKKFTN